MATQSSSSTKSIDVGSMFLMDLSVNESSELNASDANLNDINALDSISESTFPSGSLLHVGSSRNKPNHIQHHQQKQLTNNNRSDFNDQLHPGTHSRSMLYNNNKNDQHHRLNEENHRRNSLDISSTATVKDDRGSKVTNMSLEKNIENNHQLLHSHNQQLTIVEPEVPPSSEMVGHESILSASTSASSSTSSLSDESFIASSSGDESLIDSSYTASDVDEERGSTTTREDSGVLDIKDLDSRIDNSYDNEHEDRFCQQQQKTLNHQEKPINISSNNGMPANLNNKSAISNHSNIEYNDKNMIQNPNNRNTIASGSSNNNHHHHHHNNHHHQRNSQSKCTISASLPIEVPVGHMKKSLNKSKLKNRDHGKNRNNAMNAQVDDFEDFLEQEYNDNHHNHYPIDEFDEEHVRAEENPMKLFESIQALARSLHKDTELFGSLPPKRLLESPIRSLALA